MLDRAVSEAWISVISLTQTCSASSWRIVSKQTSISNRGCLSQPSAVLGSACRPTPNIRLLSIQHVTTKGRLQPNASSGLHKVSSNSDSTWCKGPNFAGHYTVPNGAAVQTVSCTLLSTSSLGSVTTRACQTLMRIIPCGLLHQRNSNLFVAEQRSTSVSKCEPSFYTWRGSRFELA